MRAGYSRLVVALAAVAVSAGGCNSQDADALGRIGKMLARRAEALRPTALPGMAPASSKDREPKYEPRPNPGPEKKDGDGGQPGPPSP